MMDIQYFDEILKDYQTARQWIEGFGVKVQGTRLDQLEKDLKDLVQAYQTKEIGKFVQRSEYRAGMYSLLEATDLVRVHKAYAHRNSNGLFHRLQRTVEGPRAGTDESDPNVAGRNHLAELSWGALLELSGFSTDIEHDPDVLQILPIVGNVPDSSVSWEVKRPRSLVGLDTRLRKGRKQIQAAMRGSKNVGGTEVIGGCIVVIMDYLMDYHQQVIVASGELAAKQALRYYLGKWWSRHRNTIYARTRREGVLGVALWWRPLAFVPNSHGHKIPAECTQLLLDDTVCRVESLGIEVVRKTIQALRH